jgi:hypothetical protein
MATMTPVTARRLARFRRRTWLVIGACLALRAVAALSGTGSDEAAQAAGAIGRPTTIFLFAQR